VDTRLPWVRVCGSARVAKLGHRTRTQATRGPKTAGLPKPVLYPMNSAYKHYYLIFVSFNLLKGPHLAIVNLLSSWKWLIILCYMYTFNQIVLFLICHYWHRFPIVDGAAVIEPSPGIDS
jgi:hypothetical protein